MLSLTTKSRAEKVKDALSDVISYTDEIVRVTTVALEPFAPAAAHGAKARDCFRTNIRDGFSTSRLANDRKLRQHARIAGRPRARRRPVRRKRSHRVRNAF